MIPFSTEWQAPEFEERERDVSWYWISIITAAVLIGFAVWQKNFLFGLFVIIAEMLVIVWAGRKPREISFAMNDQGVTIDGKKEYLWNEFESFAVDETSSDNFDYMFLHSKGRLRTPLQIIIPKDNIDDLRNILKPGLKEIEYQPSLIDSLEKIIGF